LGRRISDGQGGIQANFDLVFLNNGERRVPPFFHQILFKKEEVTSTFKNAPSRTKQKRKQKLVFARGGENFEGGGGKRYVCPNG